MSTTQVKHFGWALNLLESWFTSASNMMIKNLFTSENKTPVTTHAKCENPKPCICQNLVLILTDLLFLSMQQKI